MASPIENTRVLLPFRDRYEAGKLLAASLGAYRNRTDVLALALPRGGVPVAFEVALSLRAPLDVFVVRKLGVPGYEELAFGAIASGGVRVLNPLLVRELGMTEEMIDMIAAREQKELERRERAYRDSRPAPEVRGKVVILIDDGLATGATMLAGAKALRQKEPREIIVAVPVAAPQTCDEFRPEVDHIVCAVTREPFYAVSRWYEDFSETTDDEVRDLLERAAARPGVS
ncbi:MAG: putative phosphoribosyl transferase [Bryobacterales bacterium]|jgi:predicted phosphoribosyltransferase|nr:putative phosphoribosyl transferase [Bryobacterales bacterium]